MIISGFNPLSLAGIAKFLPVKRGNILHDARFFTSYRIKDWLQLLGFEIVEQRQVMFSTLFFQQKWKGAVKLQDYLASYSPGAVRVLIREKAGYTHDRNKTQTQFEAAFFGGGAGMTSTRIARCASINVCHVQREHATLLTRKQRQTLTIFKIH